MHVFTSITANYLPKAAVLAHSLKRVHPEAVFHLLLSDVLPECPPDALAAFDSIIDVRDLPIPDLPAWIFRHRLVELCTAVKGTAFQYIADRHGTGRIYYLDPDIVVTSRLDGLERALDRNAILLTPHMTSPETETRGIVDNEQCCLRHGVYNLGFLGVRMDGQGRQFIDWWAERLRQFCHDDIPAGLFTDQRWVDLAPAFFDDIAILRSPQYNVATWNLSHRRVAGRAPYELEVNGQPLAFYHFSGLDSGSQRAMLDRYGRESPVLYEFRDWYLEQCERYGHSTLGKLPCVYGAFDNGRRITDAHRLLYRRRPDLRDRYPDPYSTRGTSGSYEAWFQANMAGGAAAEWEGPRSLRLRRFLKAHSPEPVLSLARATRRVVRGLSRRTPAS